MAGASEEGQVIGCHTVEAWTDQLQKGNESKKLRAESFNEEWGVSLVWFTQERLPKENIDDGLLGGLAVYEAICSSAIREGNPVKIVVDFTASWCGPCRFIAPFLAELAKKFTNVIFLKVDVDELKSVAQDWAVEAMPTFVFVKEGTIVGKVVGAKKDELQQTIEKHAATASA